MFMALFKKEIEELLKTRRFYIIGGILFGGLTILAIYYGRHGGAEKLVESDVFWMIYSPMVVILAIFLSYDVISGERAKGTLGLLLSRPVSRSSILLGKLVSVLFFVGMILFLAGAYGYWLAAAVAWDLPSYATTKETFLSLGVMFLAAVCWSSFAFACSSRLKSPGNCLIVVLLLWVFINGLARAPLSGYMGAHGGPENITSIPQWMKVAFALSPEGDAEVISGYISGVPAEGLNFHILSLGWSLGILLIYFAVFLGLAFVFFRRLSLE